MPRLVTYTFGPASWRAPAIVASSSALVAPVTFRNRALLSLAWPAATFSALVIWAWIARSSRLRETPERVLVHDPALTTTSASAHRAA